MLFHNLVAHFVGLAVPFFYWREHRREFHVVRHLLLPGISMLVLIFPLYAQFVPSPSPPLNLAGPMCAVLVVLGLVIVAILRWRAPHTLTLVNKVYLEESEAAPSVDTQTSQSPDEMVSPIPEKETIHIGQ